jgi:two-component system chemotaxis response regulator CheB
VNTGSLKKTSRIVVIGASAGGIHALKTLLGAFPSNTSHVFVIVLHRLKNVESRLDSLFRHYTDIPIVEVEDKQVIEPNHIYLAPANYHLLFEDNGTFALDVSERINYSRPSIDVSFNSLANIYGKRAIAILLTGANQDGALGLKNVFESGGDCLVQNPDTAQVAIMPRSGLEQVPNAQRLHLEEIAEFIQKL